MIVTDAFTGTSGLPLQTYSIDWGVNRGSTPFKIGGNEVYHATIYDDACRWRAASNTFPPNHYAQVTIVAVGTAAYVGPAVRVAEITANTTVAGTYYGFYGNKVEMGVFRNVNTTVVTLLASIAQAFAINDVIKLVAKDSNILAYRNGALAFSTITDSVIAIGQGGICGWGNSNVTRLDNFSGGSLSTQSSVAGNLDITVLGESAYLHDFVYQSTTTEITGSGEIDVGGIGIRNIEILSPVTSGSIIIQGVSDSTFEQDGAQYFYGNGLVVMQGNADKEILMLFDASGETVISGSGSSPKEFSIGGGGEITISSKTSATSYQEIITPITGSGAIAITGNYNNIIIYNIKASGQSVISGAANSKRFPFGVERDINRIGSSLPSIGYGGLNDPSIDSVGDATTSKVEK